MNLDDDVCHCYHVPLRKLLHFARRTRPKQAAQMSECLGAGTGCGWCIPILSKIAAAADEAAAWLQRLDNARYAAERETYRKNPAARHRFEAATPNSADVSDDTTARGQAARIDGTAETMRDSRRGPAEKDSINKRNPDENRHAPGASASDETL